MVLLEFINCWFIPNSRWIFRFKGLQYIQNWSNKWWNLSFQYTNIRSWVGTSQPLHSSYKYKLKSGIDLKTRSQEELIILWSRKWRSSGKTQSARETKLNRADRIVFKCTSINSCTDKPYLYVNEPHPGILTFPQVFHGSIKQLYLQCRWLDEASHPPPTGSRL